MTERCKHCGFPADSPQPMHEFLHQMGESLAAHRGEIKRLRDGLEAIFQYHLDQGEMWLEQSDVRIDAKGMSGLHQGYAFAAIKLLDPQSSQGHSE